MMSNYDNELRGALFKNDRKESDNHPDYKGQCEIEGVEYWMDAWIKTSGAGKKFMSVSFKAKESRNPPAREPVRRSRADTLDDDIPF